jgi:hypothetical protein
LAICKQLTEMMGGTIGVDSREGHGSTFSVTAIFETATPEQNQTVSHRRGDRRSAPVAANLQARTVV